MTDTTDLTMPLTPAKLGRAVSAIVERAFPSPRQEDCMRVGEMERALTALCGEVVQLAYDDAAGIHRDGRDRLARWLWAEESGGEDHHMAYWDSPLSENTRRRLGLRADQILAVITGQGH